MAGQATHFLKYAPEDIAYARTATAQDPPAFNGVAGTAATGAKRICRGDFVSIADFSIWGWASLWEGQQQNAEDSRIWRAGWT